jgi:4-amino-4-deoxy-L-arabinose transferase-like glycosyltransferase
VTKWHGAALALPRRSATREGVFRSPLFVAVLCVLALLALACGQLGAQPQAELVVGTAQDRRSLVRFHEVEYQGERTYRWSEPRAAIFLYGFEGRPALVTLRLAAARPPELSPIALALQADGRALGSFPVGVDWRRYHLLVPTSAIGETPLLLDTAAFTVGGEDTRLLGVAVSAFGSRATMDSGLLPPFERSVFLLSLPLLAALGVWRWRGRFELAALLAMPLLLLIFWAAAFPAQAGYWLPTLLWPWWPLVPLLLVVGWPWLTTIWHHVVAIVRQQPWLGGLGIGLALLALWGARLGLPHWLATLGLISGALLALVAAGRGKALNKDSQQAVDVEEQLPSPSLAIDGQEVLAIAAITLLALTLRVVELGEQPLGLWRDEARHGLLALQIWQDSAFRPIYVVEGADLPALLFYLMAPIVGIFGPELWSARLVSALAGALTPLALWWALRPLLGARAVLGAATLLAGASWALSMSRWAFPATLDTFFVLCAIGAALRALAHTGLQAQGMLASLLIAVSVFYAALAAYTYHTGRVAPLILAAVVAAYLGRDWRAWRRALPLLMLALFVGVFTLGPLLYFYAENAEGFNRRVGRVTVFDSIELDRHAPAALLLRNIERYAAMWHLRGEPNGRHHAPEVPMLDPVAGLLFLLGLGIAAHGLFGGDARDRRPAVLLTWLGLALIPGVFSSEAPHAMRSLPALAPACALMGLALAALLPHGDTRRIGSIALAFGTRDATRVRNNALLALALFCSLTFNGWLYFGQMAQDPRVYREFDTVETAMGRLVRSADALGEPVTVLLPERVRERETLRFLTDGLAIAFYDGRAPVLDPQAAALIVLAGDASSDELAAAQAALGAGALLLEGGPRYPDGTAVLRGIGRGAAARRLWDDFEGF